MKQIAHLTTQAGNQHWTTSALDGQQQVVRHRHFFTERP
jgi:hypothetical protein